MSGDAASQFVREQEQRRHAGLPVQRHIAFDGAARTLPLSGTYTFRGQGLALLREGEDIVVIPVDAVTLRRLQLKPAGSSVKVSIKGITQPRSRGL